METKYYNLLINTEVLYNVATNGRPLRLLIWLMDKTTKRGGVLGGVPIKLSLPAKDLKVSDKTIRRWLSTLKPMLDLTRTPIGYKIKVKNYDKWHKKDDSDRSGFDRLHDNTDTPKNDVSQEPVIGQKCPSDRSKMTYPIKTITRTITSNSSKEELEGSHPLETKKEAVVIPPKKNSDSVSITDALIPPVSPAPLLPLESILKLYAELWSKYYGQPCELAGEEEEGIKGLLEDNGEETIRKALELYFDDKRRCVETEAHSISYFKKNFKAYQEKIKEVIYW